MAQGKLSFEGFRTSLRAGKYATVAGARRALGHARTFTEEEKQEAHALVNEHFNVSPSTPSAAKPSPTVEGVPMYAPFGYAQIAPPAPYWERVNLADRVITHISNAITTLSTVPPSLGEPAALSARIMAMSITLVGAVNILQTVVQEVTEATPPSPSPQVPEA